MGCLVTVAFWLDVLVGYVACWQHNLYVASLVVLTSILLLIVDFNEERKLANNG